MSSSDFDLQPVDVQATGLYVFKFLLLHSKNLRYSLLRGLSYTNEDAVYKSVSQVKGFGFQQAAALFLFAAKTLPATYTSAGVVCLATAMGLIFSPFFQDDNVATAIKIEAGHIQ